MDEVINGLDIIALTSLNEGTPVTIIEALSAGKPVVSTNVGGVADIVEHGRNGFLTASNDTIAFTNHLLDIVNDSTSLPNLQDSAIETRHQFSYTRLVADVEKLYNSLLGQVK
jgi:glycosyltransferase involved in cell wall biosynthesis